VRHLAIATWRLKTNPSPIDDMAVQAKINMYAEKADSVLLQLEVEARRLNIPNLHRIFLAPEHLFRRSSLEWALHEPQKMQVMQALRTISARHGDALLVPGTLVWREETTYAKLFNRRFEARNTAFVLQNGAVLHSYNKHSDAGELTAIESQQCAYRAGQKLGVFKCWGLRFGLEICMDHSKNTLFKQLEAENAAPVDVHLVISSSVPTMNGATAARHGGILVKSDGGDVKSSHTPQNTDPKTNNPFNPRHGVWDVEMRAQSRYGAQPADQLAAHKKNMRSEYVDLPRRNSVTMRSGVVPPEMPAYVFEGFDDDVSVYHVELPD
jgi:hypothetical protein